MMKNRILALTLALAGIAGFGITAPEARATKVTLDGSGSYFLGGKVTYLRGGAAQAGRYRNLGKDYYRRGRIQMRWVTNNSNKRSGSLSFELWANRYYGASSGIVLMTKGLRRMPGQSYYDNPVRTGWAVSLGRWRFPELNLWEYTRVGWKWRDSLSFRRRDLM